MAHIYLSATNKSSGKTTLSIGLTRELRRRGYRVQPFKKGPDYIDPLWLTEAAGRACLNLDYHTTPAHEIRQSFAALLAESDLGLIEGNVGLFDSVDLHGSNSNAELVKLLGAPLVLVIDAQGMGRGIAPLLLGYQAFDPALGIAGVILNKVGGDRHAANLRRVVEHYTDLPVVGSVPRLPSLGIEERHLGLIPSNEAGATDAIVEHIRAAVAEHVDVERIAAIAAHAELPKVEPPDDLSTGSGIAGPRVRIGIARDDAFGFYYPDDLAALTRWGADLVPFSPVHDAELPEVDALFIGGGFPECRMRELDDNASMRASVVDFIGAGGPTYAECGGLMYLAQRLHWNGRSSDMCGVIPSDVAMHARPQGRGYVRLRETEAFPWPAGRVGQISDVCAHEFHHSALTDPDPCWVYAYDVKRGTGIDGKHDGLVQRNLLASYAHLRDVGGVGWTERFVSQIRATM
ncbi:MAG: cobyrinate a,c-diamide synthase [Thiohalocapsa sp.]